jgi:hypothetical protein
MLDPLLLTAAGLLSERSAAGSRADFGPMNRAIALHRLHSVIGDASDLIRDELIWRSTCTCGMPAIRGRAALKLTS